MRISSISMQPSFVELAVCVHTVRSSARIAHSSLLDRFVSMSLVNLSVWSSSAYRSLIPWTVVQVKTGVTFANLFKKILAEAHPRLTVEEELSHSCLFVGQSKESLSEVDDKLPCSG